MKKNNSLKKFNKVAKRVYKISKKRDLGWKWQDAQKFTSANLFQKYKVIPISKIKVTEVDKSVIGILDATPTPTETATTTPKPVSTVCFDPFNIPTKDLKDINWWMLQDQVAFFDNDLNMRVAIGSIIDTGVVKKSEIMNLNETVEDMRRAGFSSDDNIIFKILVAPNKKDDGKPCSYYVFSNPDTATVDAVIEYPLGTCFEPTTFTQTILPGESFGFCLPNDKNKYVVLQGNPTVYMQSCICYL